MAFPKRVLFVPIGLVLIVSVHALYRHAPCSAFEGWGPPTFFFSTIWPALIPLILVMTVVSMLMDRKLAIKWQIWVGWGVLALLVVYGWYDGYFETYLRWKSSPGAPWPEYC